MIDKSDTIKYDEEIPVKNEKSVVDEVEEPYTIFSTKRLISFLVIVSLTGMISPLTGSIYLPSVNQIEQDLGITTEQVNLTITVYMIFQAVSPTFWGTIADSYGRRPVLLSTMVVYVAACIGCALSPNYAALIVFRMLQAFGSSSTVAIAAGILSDIVQSNNRASFYGFYSLGQMSGPLLGPVLGGIISQEIGWRWIFWILLVIGCVSMLSVGFGVPETLRALVGNGSGYANPTPTQWLARRRGKLDEVKIAAIKEANGPRPKMNFLAPFIYLFEPDVAISLWFNGVVYTIAYCYMTSNTKQFSIHYPYLTQLDIGVCFLSMGIGFIVGSIVTGKLLDRDYRIISEQFRRDCPDASETEFPIYKARFRSLWINLTFTSVMTTMYGWMFIINAPLYAILIIQFFVGFSASGVMNACQTLVIDLFPGKGASITASNNLMRCVLGAIATVCIDPGIEGIGMGWMFLTLGLFLTVNCACIPILIRYGPKWRQARLNRQSSVTNTRILWLGRFERV